MFIQKLAYSIHPNSDYTRFLLKINPNNSLDGKVEQTEKIYHFEMSD